MSEELQEKKQTFSEYLTLSLNDVSEALPKDFNKARFVQNAVALLNDTPQLQKYSKAQQKHNKFNRSRRLCKWI